MWSSKVDRIIWIHHHTGGLENIVSKLTLLNTIHHHTGGLETNLSRAHENQDYSPPHRWLRKARR